MMVTFLNKDIVNKSISLDIETISQYESFDDIPNELDVIWQSKAESYRTKYKDKQEFSGIELTDDLLYRKNSPLLPEFGKILCVSFCSYNEKSNELRATSYISIDNEKQLLENIFNIIDVLQNKGYFIAGHNIKNFDIRYLMKRAAINQLQMPTMINISGTKPWNQPFIDTMELWGGYGTESVSLDLLAHCMNVKSSKDYFNGKNVNELYWANKDKNADEIINTIGNYCAYDTITTHKILLKFANMYDNDITETIKIHNI